MSQLTYCKGWFRAKKVALESYTAEEARSRHESGDLYCVLVGSPQAPEAFLEVVKGTAGVSWLDEHLRENLSYNFQALEPGRLFLAMAVSREFVGQSEQVAEGSTYTFKPSGTVAIRRETFAPSHRAEIAESVQDVSGNWDVFPHFGEYSSLLRVERASC